MEASSAVNAPHPDDVQPEEDFFDQPASGLPTLSPEERAAEAAAYREEKGEELSPAEEQQAKLRAIAEREAAEAAHDGAEDAAQGEPAPAAASAEEQAQEPAGGGSASAAGADERRLTREYVILHQVQLTERVLQHLMEELRKGDLAEPRVAYLELDRQTARNDKQAVGQAYSRFEERLGPKADLAAVTERGFKVRHVEPRQKVQTDLTIT